MGRRDVGRSRVLGGTHYVGWVRLRPRLGYEREFAQLVSLSPHVVLEAHRVGDRLEFYAWIRDIALPLLQRRASVEPVEQPPPLEQRWVAELRAPSNAWETGVEASEAWLSVYDWLEDGEVVQIVGFYDARIHRELERKARHYRLGERPELKGLGPLEHHRRDPDKAKHLSRLSTKRIYVTAVRFYTNDKKRARELGERASGLFTPALKVRVSRRGSPSKLRDPMSLMGRFGPRKEYPWIPQESFMHLVRLPRPDEVSALVEFARGGELPSITPRVRPGETCIRFGETLDGKEYCVPLRQLLHTWVIGRTKGGKSTFLWNLILRLREAREGAVVLIDPHGDLSYNVLESLPSMDRVWLVDPGYVAEDGSRPFLASLNPLDPPRLPDRGQAYDLATDHLVEMFERVLALSGTSVRIKYLLQVVLRYMYHRLGGRVTLADLYDTFLALYRGELDLPIDDPEWRHQLELLRDMSEDSFFGVFSRLEPFRNNKLLRAMTAESTLDLDTVLQPGGLLILRLPSGAVGPQGFRLLAPMIVLRIWFWALERALLGKPRTPVYIVMDEFQNVAEAIPDVIDTVLSEARKYGLILVMAHQHLHQYSEKLLRSMFTNTLVKVFFPVADARDIAALSAVDADFAEEIRRALSGLPGGSALVSVAPDFGEPPAPPTVVKMDPPPRRRASNIRPLTELLPRFTPPPEPVEGDIVSKLNPVLRFLPRGLHPVEAWVLFHVYEATDAGGREELWSNILVRLGLPRNRADEARNALASKGLIEARREGNRWLVRYVKGLFEGLRAAAPGEEGYRLAGEALLYYFQHGYIVYPARQDPGLPSKPDLVAIPWDPSSMSLRYDRSIAIEIESCNELSTHGEQVVRNLLKHQRGVFSEVHVWAPAGCRGRLLEVLERVKPRLPLPVMVMPEEPRGAAGGKAGSGEAVEEEAPGAEEEAGRILEEPGERRRVEKASAGGSSKPEAPGGAEEPGEPHSLRQLLEAQATTMKQLAEAVQALAETQKTILRLLEHQNKLLQQLAKTTSQRREDTHRDNKEPTQEPTHRQEEPPRQQEAQTPGENKEHSTEEHQNLQEPEYDPENQCYWIPLDHPHGEETCLPEPQATKALQLRARGYKLKKTRTGRIYAARGATRIWIGNEGPRRAA